MSDLKTHWNDLFGFLRLWTLFSYYYAFKLKFRALNWLKLIKNLFMKLCKCIDKLHIILCYSEKLVLGKTSVMEVNVTNTGSTSRVFQVTTTSAPAGFVTESSHLVTVATHAFQIVNIPVTAKSLTLAWAYEV